MSFIVRVMFLCACRLAGTEAEYRDTAKECVFGMRDRWVLINAGLAVLFVLCGVLLGYFLYANLHSQQISSWKSSFDQQCQQRSQVLVLRLDLIGAKLLGLTGFVTVLARRTYSQFGFTTMPFTQPEFDEWAQLSYANRRIDGAVYLNFVRPSQRADWESTYHKNISLLLGNNNGTLEWKREPDSPYYLTVANAFPAIISTGHYDLHGLEFLPYINFTFLMERCMLRFDLFVL